MTWPKINIQDYLKPWPEPHNHQPRTRHNQPEPDIIFTSIINLIPAPTFYHQKGWIETTLQNPKGTALFHTKIIRKNVTLDLLTTKHKYLPIQIIHHPNHQPIYTPTYTTHPIPIKSIQTEIEKTIHVIMNFEHRFDAEHENI